MWYRAGLWTVTDKTRIRDSGIQVVKGTVVEAVIPILWPPNSKKRLTGKNPDAGKD